MTDNNNSNKKSTLEEMTARWVNQLKKEVEELSHNAQNKGRQMREQLEKQNIKSVSLHLRNGERIDALMTPKQRKELDRLVAKGRGGLVSVREAVFVGNNQKMSDRAEQLKVSVEEIVAVSVKALKDESDSFFSTVAEGNTVREKFDKMREAMHKPINVQGNGAVVEDQSTTKKPAAKKPAAKKPAPKSTARKPATKKPATKKPAAKSTARKPAAKKPAAKKPAAKSTARKPAAKKPAAKSTARKPAAKKPAARKNK